MKVKIRKTPKEAKNGATLEPLSYDMQLFHGPSHDNGGIPYKGVEVEGNEPLYKALDGSEIIFGNMTVPGTDQKFKSVAQLLAKKDQRVDKIISKAVALVNDNDPQDKWGELKFNAGRAMLSGGVQKKNELKQNKEHLATLQQAILDAAEEMGADPQALSKGKIKQAKYGMKLAEDGWKFKGTNKDKLDQKILEFANLVAKKGYTGYSGPQSGYDKRNTKSGRKSRHASNQALDMIFDDPEVYDKILKDPELSGFLINNGLTAINEYDPANKKKTGADVGHLHIGYDQGTALSDAFRTQAAGLYKDKNPDWNWSKIVKGNNTPIPGAKAGDVQLEPFTPFTVGNTPVPGKQNKPGPRTVKGNDDPLDITPYSKKPIPSNAKGLDLYQIAPEVLAYAQNQVEPVALQQYNPQLFQSTKVSFQDQLNENQTSFNSLERIMQNNPTALATLAGQKYAADNKVMGEEFRTNQQIEQDVVNKNISLLNDAQLKNLGLADQQYVRQSQARSNTKALNNTILNSITSKIAQTEARNQALKYYEAMTDYRFNPETGQMDYHGAPGGEYINWGGNPSGTSRDARVTVTKDEKGNIQSTKEVMPSSLDTRIKENQLWNQTFKVPNIIDGLGKKKPYTLRENGGTIQQLFKKR
jgi:hypothetical protein